jgi:AraC-like DNA-binding protein
MYSAIVAIIASIALTVSALCSWVLWTKRREVSDHSRIYLIILDLMVLAYSAGIIISSLNDLSLARFNVILEPHLSIVGLYAITLFTHYPIEVIRPRQLYGRQMLLLWLPSLLVTLPLLFGMKFQMLQSWGDVAEHLFEFNVLLRLLAVALLTVFSLLILLIPYNWRQSSADYRWIRQAAFMSLVTSILFYGRIFSCMHLFFILHSVWCIIWVLYFTYYEVYLRVIPPAKSEAKSSTRKPSETEKPAAIVASVAEETGDYWPMICQVMDEWEAWRNPNTTVETVSSAVGTNRIYVARCIKEHTGMTFNDYMNKKRISYMASQLRLNPKQDHKHLYFDIGFRSRHTAYRNFVKFQGCSPTEFVAALLRS